RLLVACRRKLWGREGCHARDEGKWYKIRLGMTRSSPKTAGRSRVHHIARRAVAPNVDIRCEGGPESLEVRDHDHRIPVRSAEFWDRVAHAIDHRAVRMPDFARELRAAFDARPVSVADVAGQRLEPRSLRLGDCRPKPVVGPGATVRRRDRRSL